MKKALQTVLILNILFAAGFAQEQDPHQWLENVDDQKALSWVEEQNTKTLDVLMKQESYQPIYEKSLEIYNSADRIPTPSIYGNYIYNFWQDQQNERGIWRRTAKTTYMSGEPEWETLLDLDAMYSQDSIKWVFKGATGLSPDYNLFILSLSKGGGDAVVRREFNVEKKAFVEKGFEMPEAKGAASWIDKNTLLISSNFGEGTVTTSGYPRQVKIWKRGTPLESAKLIFTGNESDVGTWGFTVNKPNRTYTMLTQAITFYTSKTYAYENNQLIELAIPDDADLSEILGDQAIIELKSDWEVNGKTLPQGAVISAHYDKLLKGEYELSVVFVPDETSSVTSMLSTRNQLIINVLTNVKSELRSYSFNYGEWVSKKIDAPDYGTIRLSASDDLTDQYFFYYQNFLTPSSLFFADDAKNSIQVVQSLPAFFDGEKYEVVQYESISKDGTKIPYFVVGAKNMDRNGANPTLLYGYGGFEVPMLPFYSGTFGNNWLANGGVFVLANIRGGGEFGPRWHQAGLKENRQRVYDDFHSVAENLIKRKITSSRNLGIMGGSNGGLLVGVAFTQRPDLYNAVICAVPLLDMKRFNKLLAGASWMGEYGDPDKPEEWEFIKTYSPYHNLKKDTEYPEVFFTTSTRDDRVHPGHARKMVAKMNAMGHKVFYYENTEGGHAGSSTNAQRAKVAGLQFSYLLMKLTGKPIVN
ncbi:MAG: prolyl oligopeptidase family serine peptidase [Calditrichia bacterium]